MTKIYILINAFQQFLWNNILIIIINIIIKKNNIPLSPLPQLQLQSTDEQSFLQQPQQQLLHSLS